MKRLISIMIVVFIFCCSCDLTYFIRELKPYDPEKAGATIVESFDITDQVRFTRLDRANINIAGNNNAIYIRDSSFIYVFDKQTFKLINEIQLERFITGRVNGMAITVDENTFLLSPWGNLFSVDLTTGEGVRVDDFVVEDGVNYSDFHFDEMGYNMADNSIWFHRPGSVVMALEPLYYFFNFTTYDGFKFLDRKVGNNHQLHNLKVGGIYGSILWRSGHDYIGGTTIGNVGIWIFNLDNLSEIKHFINVEYLNTFTIPKTPHFDGEHFWLVVERGSRILMLKLLPHW